MNKLLNIGLFICAICAGLTSCNKDPEYFELPTYPDQMKVQSSATEMVLQEENANEVALVLTWNKVVSPVSPDDKVSYKVCFYPTVDKQKKSKYIDTDENRLELTHNELNSMLARWALAGEAMKVTAQVLSVVDSEQKYVKPQVSTIELTLTGWEKYPQYLYMVMTDDEGNQKRERLEQNQLGTGVYQALIKLKPCTYHFTTNATGDYPIYCMNPEGDGEQMDFVVQGEYTDFINSIDGERTVMVDVNGDFNDCRIINMIKLPSDHIWIVGDGCSVGWVENNPAGYFEMIGGIREPWIWAWTGEFLEPYEKGKKANGEPEMTEGRFKIGLQSSYNEQMLFAPKADADPAVEKGIDGPRSGGDDNKWLVTKESAGIHTLTLYLLKDDLHLEFE